MITNPKEIALYFANGGMLSSFEQALMELIQKADNENKKQLELAYPEYVEAYYLWFRGEY